MYDRQEPTATWTSWPVGVVGHPRVVDKEFIETERERKYSRPSTAVVAITTTGEDVVERSRQFPPGPPPSDISPSLITT